MKRNHAAETAALVHVINPSCLTMNKHLPKTKKKRQPYVRTKEKNNMVEKAFEVKVILYLRLKGCIVHKSGEQATYNNMYILPGFPDLWVINPYKRLFAFVECKTPTGQWSLSQKDFKKICDANNILYILCRKLSDLGGIL